VRRAAAVPGNEQQWRAARPRGRARAADGGADYARIPGLQAQLQWRLARHGEAEALLADSLDGLGRFEESRGDHEQAPQLARRILPAPDPTSPSCSTATPTAGRKRPTTQRGAKVNDRTGKRGRHEPDHNPALSDGASLMTASIQ
jgi:hypothetical protein